MFARTMLAVATLTAKVPDVPPTSPGQWEITNTLTRATFDGRSDNVPAAPFSNRVCLTAKAAARGPGLAFSDPATCAVKQSEIADGDYSYQLVCRSTTSDDIIDTTVSGHYSANAYDGKSISRQRRGSTEIEMDSNVKARRVGAC